MNALKIFLLFFFCATFAQAQTNDTNVFRSIAEINIEAKNIQTDNLGNLFVVSTTNQLYKYSQEGKLLSTLNYKYLGNISFIDATNPLEIYVFYKELNLVVFLDNNLAYRGEMKLDNFQIGQASAVARSFDNGLWAFDLADLQLKRIDKNGENLQSSGNIRQFVSQKNITPTYIYDDNNRVFVVDSTVGIMVFDVFAHYLKTIPIKGVSKIKAMNDNMFYSLENMLYKYHQKTLQTTTFSLPTSSTILDINIEKSRLYLLEKSGVRIFEF